MEAVKAGAMGSSRPTGRYSDGSGSVAAATNTAAPRPLGYLTRRTVELAFSCNRGLRYSTLEPSYIMTVSLNSAPTPTSCECLGRRPCYTAYRVGPANLTFTISYVLLLGELSTVSLRLVL